MAKVRILIVDDSAVIRRLLAEDLAASADVDVVGAAADGKEALEKIAQLKPDLVILDVHMPVMDGLATLTEIRKSDPVLPVIMFSRLTAAGICSTIEALLLGASDYVSKPSHLEKGRRSVLAELLPKIKRLCPAPSAAPKTDFSPGTTSAPKTGEGDERTEFARRPSAPTKPGSVDVVAIGASTGGPNALADLLALFTKPFPVPVVIVQHMPKEFTPLLAERLCACSGLRVREGKAGELLRPNEAWVAPGGFHLEVCKASDGVRMLITEGPCENSCRPSVDVLFRSVASSYGPRSLGIVLTGMGHDGLAGAKAIRDAGGRVFVQDQASSVVWGMPGAVARAGTADRVLPVDQLAREINGNTSTRHVALDFASASPLFPKPGRLAAKAA